MGLTEEEMMKRVRVKEAKKRFESLMKDFDKKMIRDYFAEGVVAQAFIDPNSGKILGDGDVLSTAFGDKKFSYTIIRRPLHDPTKTLAKMNPQVFKAMLASGQVQFANQPPQKREDEL